MKDLEILHLKLNSLFEELFNVQLRLIFPLHHFNNNRYLEYSGNKIRPQE